MSTAVSFPRGRSAIVGGATFGIGEMPGFTALELAASAGLSALADARLTLADVDGLFVCLPDDMLSGLSLAEYYGLHPLITENNRTGGSAFMSHVVSAALALDAGLCNVALVTYGAVPRTSRSFALPPGGSPYETPFKPSLAASYALAARRHMHEFGTTAAQLATVAVSARRWAQHNPQAFKRAELTVEDCLAARIVAAPLRVSDCCLVTDGAAAIVLVRADRAKDLCTRPAYVLGGAAATSHRYIAAMPDLTVTAAVESGQRAFAQAGVGPADVDIAQLYDAFTINTILFLEDLGFCPKGEGGRFVLDGRIAPGGELPVNTNGGGLSCVHPGMYGLFALEEAFRQLNGTARGLQIPDATIALAHGSGGVLSSQVTVILGSEDSL
jgi:acetyl-CoA acetyltransferase